MTKNAVNLLVKMHRIVNELLGMSQFMKNQFINNLWCLVNQKTIDLYTQVVLLLS